MSLPEQKELFYPLVEEVFSRFVPLFNLALADLNERIHHHKRVGEPDVLGEDDIHDHGVLSFEKHSERWQKILEDFSNGRDISVGRRT